METRSEATSHRECRVEFIIWVEFKRAKRSRSPFHRHYPLRPIKIFFNFRDRFDSRPQVKDTWRDQKRKILSPKSPTRNTLSPFWRGRHVHLGRKIAKIDGDVLGAQHAWWKDGSDDGGGCASPGPSLEKFPWNSAQRRGHVTRIAIGEISNSLPLRHLLLDFHLLASTLSAASSC